MFVVVIVVIVVIALVVVLLLALRKYKQKTQEEHTEEENLNSNGNVTGNKDIINIESPAAAIQLEGNLKAVAAKPEDIPDDEEVLHVHLVF